MFEIHDDIEVLKRMNMACGLEVGNCSQENLKVARSLVPKALEPYVIGQCYSPEFTTCSFLFISQSVVVRQYYQNCKVEVVKDISQSFWCLCPVIVVTGGIMCSCSPSIPVLWTLLHFFLNLTSSWLDWTVLVVKDQCYCDLSKPLFGHNLRFHSVILARFNTNQCM